MELNKGISASEVDLEIQEKEQNLFSIKINGVECGQHLCGLEYIIRPGETPRLRLETYVQGVHLHTKAVLDIPKPYQFALASLSGSNAENLSD